MREVYLLDQQISQGDQRKRALPAGFLDTALEDYPGNSAFHHQQNADRLKKRKPQTKQIKEEERRLKFFKELRTLDGLGKKAFPVFDDDAVFGHELPQFSSDGRETLIDSAQDDDVESDSDVVLSGEQTSLKDLLIVKDWLKLPAEKIRVNLKTFKLWAPLFGGTLPYKRSARMRAQHPMDRPGHDRSRSNMVPIRGYQSFQRTGRR